MTPHINAKKDQISSTVIMPGDPLRAKWIAENFLEKPELVNTVRNMFAYTGKYKNKSVTVMAHGMGIPSIGIYSYELFNFYDVQNIIRVGSCGSYDAKIKLGDVFIAEEAFSDSTYNELIHIPVKNKVINASANLVDLAKKISKEKNIHTTVGRCNSEDAFYNAYSLEENIKRTNSKVVEMEAFGLYGNAIKLKKNALTLLTVSDSLVTHESMSPEDRQTTFKNMVQLALEMSLEL